MGRVQLHAELKAIDRWDQEYGESKTRDVVDEGAFQARHARRKEILLELQTEESSTPRIGEISLAIPRPLLPLLNSPTHEIRNKLAIIMATCDLLRDRVAPDEQASKWVNVIRTAVRDVA